MRKKTKTCEEGDLKLKQKMTTGRLEWNDIQREIDILNNELKQLETDKPQYGK